MYELMIFCLQLLAVTAYLVMLILFTMGMLQGHFRNTGQSFGAPHPEVLAALREINRKLDATLSSDD